MQAAVGIDCVIVNGAVAYESGVYRGSRKDVMLKRMAPVKVRPPKRNY